MTSRFIDLSEKFSGQFILYPLRLIRMFQPLISENSLALGGNSSFHSEQQSVTPNHTRHLSPRKIRRTFPIRREHRADTRNAREQKKTPPRQRSFAPIVSPLTRTNYERARRDNALEIARARASEFFSHTRFSWRARIVCARAARCFPLVFFFFLPLLSAWL